MIQLNWLNNNLGNVYCYRKIDFQKGIKHYKTKVKYSIKHNDEYEIMFSKLNIGSAYLQLKILVMVFSTLMTSKIMSIKNGIESKKFR